MSSMMSYAWKCMCSECLSLFVLIDLKEHGPHVVGSVEVSTLQSENILARSQVVARFDINTVATSVMEQVQVSGIDILLFIWHYCFASCCTE